MGGDYIIRQGENLNYVFMYTDLGSSLQPGRSWVWDTRNEMSYEETLHTLHSTPLFMICFMIFLCFMLLLALWLGQC